MGAYNEVMIEGQAVQIRHGLNRQIKYNFGDRISWEGLTRPEEADDTLWIPGVCGEKEKYRFYRVKVVNDVIVDAVEITEREFDELEAEERSQD